MRLAFLLGLLPAIAAAQPVVVSPQAEDVSVTVYRNPDRAPGEQMAENWLNGYALITETRTVSVPAGPADVRFEGIAGNIFPQSVILSGLPGLPDEKNYDARLLTPGALVGGALGQQVTIRRTNRATGEIVEEQAILRAGPNDIVIETAAGIEPYQCTGLYETMLFDEVPDGLSDKPTLSIRTNLPAPVQARVQLSYLAGQFDWDANYVARLDPDGTTMSLFSWLTVGNRNSESFEESQLLAIAGEPNREDRNAPGTYAPGIQLNCWPQDNPPPPPPPPPAPQRGYAADEMIVVTGSRVEARAMEMASPVAMMAAQEVLGDLKLYRVPERVTVAASGQKQIAFLQKDRVEVERLHVLDLSAFGYEEMETAMQIELRARNRKEDGLGEPLPTGNVAVFEQYAGEWLLVGQDSVENIPVGQKMKLEIGQSPDVRLRQRALDIIEDEDGRPLRDVRFEITVTNARPFPVDIEVPLRTYTNQSLIKSSARLVDREGRKAWVTSLKPESRKTLTYTVRTKRD